MHNRFIDAINTMTHSELRDLITNGRCPYPVHMLIGVPMGMFHCPLCGLMSVAGFPHPRYTWVDGVFPDGWADFLVEELPDEDKLCRSQTGENKDEEHVGSGRQIGHTSASPGNPEGPDQAFLAGAEGPDQGTGLRGQVHSEGGK